MAAAPRTFLILAFVLGLASAATFAMVALAWSVGVDTQRGVELLAGVKAAGFALLAGCIAFAVFAQAVRPD